MHKLSVFILVAGISGLALPTLAQTFSAPPLQSNELIVKTKDDCGIVMAQRGDALDKHEINRISNVTWGGLCINGLVMGEGSLYTEARGLAWYGRPFGEAKWEHSSGVVTQLFFWDGKAVSYNTLDATKAVWSTNRQQKSSVIDTQTMVMAQSTPYRVSVLNLLNPKFEDYSCPDPQSPSGCDAIWAKHAGPVIANIKAFISKNQAAAKARKLETQAIVEQFKLRFAACTKEGAASSSCPQTQPSEEQAHIRAVAQADVLKRAERQEEENKVRIAREAREKVEREQREAEERARLKAEADERERRRKLAPPGNTSPPTSPTGQANNSQASARGCEAEYRRFAEIEATQFNNPRYLGLTPEAVDRLMEDMFQQSFQGWMPNSPNGLRPFEQNLNDPETLRHYAKDKLEAGQDPRWRLQSAITSCVALKRAAKLSQGPAPTGGNAPVTPGKTATVVESLEHNPLHDASSCIRFSGPDEMKARGLHGVLPSRIDNTCSFPIAVRWCVEAGGGRRGDCNPGYSNAATLAPPGGQGTSSYGVDAVNQTVRIAACKKGGDWGFQPLKTDPRKPFDYACK